jgi:hypothetical protein
VLQPPSAADRLTEPDSWRHRMDEADIRFRILETLVTGTAFG